MVEVKVTIDDVVDRITVNACLFEQLGCTFGHLRVRETKFFADTFWIRFQILEARIVNGKANRVLSSSTNLPNAQVKHQTFA